jgi:hypothetical protein
MYHAVSKNHHDTAPAGNKDSFFSPEQPPLFLALCPPRISRINIMPIQLYTKLVDDSNPHSRQHTDPSRESAGGITVVHQPRGREEEGSGVSLFFNSRSLGAGIASFGSGCWSGVDRADWLGTEGPASPLDFAGVRHSSLSAGEGDTRRGATYPSGRLSCQAFITEFRAREILKDGNRVARICKSEGGFNIANGWVYSYMTSRCTHANHGTNLSSPKHWLE